MSDFVIAMSRFKRHKYKECLELVDQMLEENNRDKAAFQLKLNCLIMQNKDEELDLDEQPLAELLLDEKSKQTVVRPGTSFASQP